MFSQDSLRRRVHSEFLKRLWVDVQFILVIGLSAAMAVLFVVAALNGEELGA